MLLWGWFMLPRSERLENAPRIDVAGSVLLGVFLVCLLVPLTFSPEWGWASPSTLGLLVVSAAAFVAFVIVERRVESPILDLDLVLKNRLFAAANTAALLNYMALYGISLLTAIYLELVQGSSASLTGWLLLSMPLLMAVLSPFSGRLSDRIGSRVLASGGMVAIAAGMLLLALTPESAPLWRIAACLAVVGLGMAAFSAPNTSAIMGSVRRDQLSQASAFLSTMRTSGQALSVALLGGIAASQLGAVGGRVLLTHGHGGGALAAQRRGRLRAGLSLRDGHRRRARAGRRARLAHHGARTSPTPREPAGALTPGRLRALSGGQASTEGRGPDPSSDGRRECEAPPGAAEVTQHALHRSQPGARRSPSSASSCSSCS